MSNLVVVGFDEAHKAEEVRLKLYDNLASFSFYSDQL
jgi:uncharacterized membrane protein